MAMLWNSELEMSDSFERAMEFLKHETPNLYRLVSHLSNHYQMDMKCLINQDQKMMKNVHHLTSSAQFLQAIRQRDFDKAREVTRLNPWAVRASEPND